MREIAVKGRESDGRSILELEFKALDQLLDPSDPFPLPRRELTEVAEEAIAGYVDEFSLKRPIELTISLPPDSIATDVFGRIPDTVRRHFTFRLNDLAHEKRLSLREGRISFALAIFNAAIAILFVLFFSPFLEDNVFLLLGGLVTILNWVTIWDTYEYFVYDYRQLVRRQKIFRKITAMDIRVNGRSAEQKTS